MSAKDSSYDTKECIYRRGIRVVNDGLSTCVELEDDFHHFSVTMQHDGDKATSVSARSIRFPWDTCGAESSKALSQLAGVRLSSLFDQLTSEQRFEYCTHLYDMLELAVSHAHRDEVERAYGIEVHLIPGKGAIAARLSLNNRVLLHWRLDEGLIVEPVPFAGIKIVEFSEWARKTLSGDDLEFAIILQRGVHVSFGKIYDWSFAKSAADMKMRPTCYTFNPVRSGRAVPIPNHDRDFEAHPENLLNGRIIFSSDE